MAKSPGPDEVIVSRTLIRDLIRKLEEKATREYKENAALIRALAVSIGDVTPMKRVEKVPSDRGRVSKCAELAKKMRID